MLCLTRAVLSLMTLSISPTPERHRLCPARMNVLLRPLPGVCFVIVCFFLWTIWNFYNVKKWNTELNNVSYPEITSDGVLFPIFFKFCLLRGGMTWGKHSVSHGRFLKPKYWVRPLSDFQTVIQFLIFLLNKWSLLSSICWQKQQQQLSLSLANTSYTSLSGFPQWFSLPVHQILLNASLSYNNAERELSFPFLSLPSKTSAFHFFLYVHSTKVSSFSLNKFLLWQIKFILVSSKYSVIVTTNFPCVQESVIMKMIFQLISFSTTRWSVYV